MWDLHVSNQSSLIKRIKKETSREVIIRILVGPEREVTDKYVQKVAQVRAVGPLMVLVGDSHDVSRFNDADGTLYEKMSTGKKKDDVVADANGDADTGPY
jgi:hypothetical protein